MIPKIRTLLVFSFILGILLFAYQHAIIIIQWPGKQHTHAPTYQSATKKTMYLHYWHNDTWHKEKNKLIVTDDGAQTLTYIINAWLTLLYEEKIMPKKIALQTVLVSPTGHELFVSFDHTPFTTQQPIYEKWLWIEALFKTIKECAPSIDHVHMLVRHKPLHDVHLDLSRAWPISGFEHH